MGRTFHRSLRRDRPIAEFFRSLNLGTRQPGRHEHRAHGDGPERFPVVDLGCSCSLTPSFSHFGGLPVPHHQNLLRRLNRVDVSGITQGVTRA